MNQNYGSMAYEAPELTYHHMLRKGHICFQFPPTASNIYNLQDLSLSWFYFPFLLASFRLMGSMARMTNSFS